MTPSCMAAMNQPGIVSQSHHSAGAPVALLGELGHARLAHRHERVLGRDEEPVQQDENGDGEKLEGDRHAPFSGAQVLEGSSSTHAAV